MTAKRTTAAIYCRISKDSGGERLGVERQENECRALAERLGFDVVAVHIDNDISAYSGKRRPGYEAMLGQMTTGEIGAVLAWHPDRLTRRPTELEMLIDVLNEAKVNVFTVSAGTYDLSTPAGRMTSRIVGATAKYESEQKAERQRSKNDQSATKGAAPAGRAPYGYRRSAGGYEINIDEAEHLRRMAAWVLEGRSLLWCARESDRLGVTTKQGRPWHHSTVRTALLNPAVAGLRVHRREVAGAGSWTPILDRSTWDALHNVLADPARKRRRPAVKYLLSGLVVSTSGQRMVGRPAESGRRTYITPSPVTGGVFASIDADRLEALTVEALLQRLDTVALEVPTPPADAAQSEAEEIEAELKALAQLRGARTISMDEWLAARKPLEELLAEARRAAPVPVVVDELLTKPGVLRAAWPDLDMTAKRRVLTQALVHVEVTGAGGKGRWAKAEDRIIPLYVDRKP